jgi:hypothetical protein
MRSICVRWACFLAAFACASVVAGEGDQRDAKQPSTAATLGGATPRIIIEEEEEELLGVSDKSAAKAEDKAQAKPEQDATFVVTCKLVEPKRKSGLKGPGLVVSTVPADKAIKIQMGLRVEDLPGGGAAELEELRLDVPGTDGAETVPVGHQVVVKVGRTGANRVRLDAAVEFRSLEGKHKDGFRLAGQSGRFVGELATGKPVQVVLETDDNGQPKHWVEFVVRFADEETDERAAEASRLYPVAYSVAGLVSVGKKVKAGKQPELDFAPIIEKIETKIAPESWAGAGGPGKIQAFARTASLVVTQTPEVHKELAAYLRRLIDDEDAIQQAIYEER